MAKKRKSPVGHEETAQEHRESTHRWKRYERPATIALTALLILIPVFLAVALRAHPASLPVADGWAENYINQNIRSQISQQVSREFPNLPAQNRAELVEQRFSAYMEQNAATLAPQAEQIADQFRSELQDANGHTYLPDLDTYFHLQRMENMLENGHPGDELKDGEPWNAHMLAPLGTAAYSDFYAWFNANVYRAARLFNPSTTPIYVFFWIPVLLAALTVIPTFFIGRKEGLIAGFVAAVLIAVHPSVIGRTSAGFADTDMLVVFFSVLVAWLFLEALEAAVGSWWRRGLWLLATGLAFGLFAWAWNWWFYFDVFLVALFGHVAFELAREGIKSRKLSALWSPRVRWSLVMLGGFILSCFVFVSLFTGPTTFLRQTIGGFGVSSTFKDAITQGSLYPNVMTTVAELNEPSISAIIDSTGGKLLFFFALMGMLFAMVPKDRLRAKDWILLGVGAVAFLVLLSSTGTSLSIIGFLALMGVPVLIGGLLILRDDRGVDAKFAIFLAAWLAASLFAMTQGVRFILLVVPPIVLGVATTVGTVYALLVRWLSEDEGLSKSWVAPVLFILLAALLIPLAVQGNEAGKQGVPHMTDAWWESLSAIDAQAAPDAVINSWWDYGHWFKYVGDRRVTFDGASQHGELAHFIGRALIAPDEKETLAILRMVDCGSYTGAYALEDRLPGNDQYEAIMLTKRIILLPHAEARETLIESGLSGEDADEVLALTHCAPPENYFITSGDMVGKGAVWGHFGSWDFAKADAHQSFYSTPRADAVPRMAEKYGWSEDEAGRVYDDMRRLTGEDAVNAWIAPWPNYVSSSWSSCAPQGESLLLCQLGVNLGQNGQTTQVLEGLVINASNISGSFISIGFYDQQNNKLGANYDLRPDSLVLIQNGTTRTVTMQGDTLGQSFIIDLDSDVPRAMMANPLHADSMFLRLFFLEGRGTTAFEKVSDRTDFMGTRIIVWKVDWSKLAELGLE